MTHPHIAPRLLELVAPNADDIAATTLGYRGWTSSPTTFDAFWRQLGYDGIRFIGQGNRLVPGDAESTLVIGRMAGYVRIENVTITAGSRRAIFAGLDALNRDDLRPFTLHLVGCRIEADAATVWGIHSYACDLILEDCTFDLEASTEHAVYAHGFSFAGARVERCTIEAVGAEGLKFTARPLTEFYPEGFDVARLAPHREVDGMHPTVGASIFIQDTKIRNWHQPHSWRGGAGLVVQGAGADIVVNRCVFEARAGDHKPAVAIDNGGWEHFGPDGTAGVGPANGKVLLMESIFKTGGLDHGSWQHWVPVVRVANSGPETGPVCEGLAVDRCAILGALTRFEIGDMPADRVEVVGCNAPEMGPVLQDQGIDPATPGSMLQFNGGWAPVSEGS